MSTTITTVRGVDVSSVQGKVPWKALASAGYRFAIIKCQQGNDFRDPMFESNLSAVKDAGLIPGAYHFCYPLPHLDPVKQAEGFYKASPCGEGLGELPPSLDFEWPAPEEWAKWKCEPKQTADWTRRCLIRMTELFNCKPLVYTYPWFMQALKRGGAELDFLAEYPLWMADYRFAGSEINPTQKPVLPYPWTDWKFWQHDGNGGLKLPNGVDSDFCVFNGTETDLIRFTRGYERVVEMDGGIIHPYPDFQPITPSDE